MLRDDITEHSKLRQTDIIRNLYVGMYVYTYTHIYIHIYGYGHPHHMYYIGLVTAIANIGGVRHRNV